jgi:hypothetical protein
MVFYGFYHYFVLKRWFRHLHSTGFSNRRMRYVTVTADFIGSIYYYDPLLFGQNPGHFTQHGGLAHTWPAEKKYALTILNEFRYYVNRSINGATNSAG